MELGTRKNVFFILFSLSLLFLLVSNVSAFNFNITIKYQNGTPVTGADLYLDLFSTAGGPPSLNQTYYNTSDSNGLVLIQGITNGTDNLKPAGSTDSFYKIKVFKNVSNQITFTGPILTYFNSEIFEKAISGSVIFLEPAIGINITVFNVTNTSQLMYRAIEVVDGVYGNRLPVSSEDMSKSQNIIYLPLNSNFSFFIYGNTFAPMSVGYGPDKYYTVRCDLNQSKFFAGNISHCSINASVRLISIIGTVNTSVSGSLTNFKNINFLLNPGNRVYGSGGGAFRNLGQMGMFAGGPNYNDTLNGDTGVFNITIPAAEVGIESFIMFFGTNLTYYSAISNLSVNLQSPATIDLGTLTPTTLYGASGVYNFSNVMPNGQDLSITTNITSFNLGQPAGAKGFFTEILVTYPNTKQIRWTFAPSFLGSSTTTTLRLPILTGSSAQVNIFAMGAAPKKLSLSSSKLAGSSTFSTNITNFDRKMPNGTQINSNVKIEMFFYNSTCNVPNPDSGCELFNFADASSSDMSMKSFKLMMLGKANVRMKDMSSNTSVMYIGVNLKNSNAPPADFGNNAESSDQSGNKYSEVWKFGSTGPETYEYVYSCFKYNDASVNDANPINMTITNLYDTTSNDNWTSVWDSSQNKASVLNLSDYSGRFSEWSQLLNGTTCHDLSTPLNATNPCGVNISLNIVCLRIPHFSGSGTNMSGSSTGDSTAPNITLVSPTGGVSSSLLQYFAGSFTDDVSLANITLYVWNSTYSAVNVTTQSITGSTNTSNITVLLPRNDTYKWNYYACDNSSNCAFADANNTLIVGPGTVSLIFLNVTASFKNANLYNNAVYRINVTNNASDFTVFTFNVSINSSYVTGLVNGSSSVSYTLTNQASVEFNITINGTKKELVSLTVNGYPTLNPELAVNSVSQLSLVANITDNIAPVVGLISPSNNSYLNSLANSFVCSVNEIGFSYINYTTFLWNSTGSLFNINSSENSSSGNQILGNYSRTLNAPTQGNYTWSCLGTDSSGNSAWATEINYTIVIDQTIPQLSFNAGSTNDFTNTTNSFVYVNVTTNETYFSTITYKLFNSSGQVNSTVYSSLTKNINWTSLTNGVYYYNVTLCDLASNCNTSTTRTITLDSASPTTNLSTPANGSYSSNSQNNFTAIVTDNTAIKNTTLNIYNSTGLVNQTTTTFTSGVTSSIIGTVISLINGVYDWFYESFDWTGNSVLSANKTITVDTDKPGVVITTPTANQLLNSTLISINITISDPNLYYTNISISSGLTIINTTNTTASGTNIYNLTVPSQGNYSLSVTSYDLANNSNTSLKTFAVDTSAPALTILSPLSNKTYYINQTMILSFLATDVSGVYQWYNNGTTVSYTAPTNLIYATNGSYNLTVYANDSLGRETSSVIYFNITDIPENTTIINSSSVTVNDNTTTLVVPYNSSLQTVVISENYSTSDVSLDLSQLNNNGNVTLGGNNFTLVREGTNNYTATISSGTSITSNNSWDGKLSLPKVNSGSFTAPSESGNTTTVSLVVDMGSSVELNFSSPVKIIIGGKAGMRAAWTRGSSTLNIITTVCNSITSPGNIDAVITRECFIDSGSDLLIWTYHFTSFAAYNGSATPVSDSNDNGGGGGGGGAVITGGTYMPTDALLKAGYIKEITTKDRIRFNLGKDTHYLYLKRASNSVATIIVNSTPQYADINVGETKRFELNGDDFYDLSVKLNKVNATSGKAEFLMTSISEQMPKTTTPTPSPSPVESVAPLEPEPIKTDSPVETKTTDNSAMTLVFVIVIGIIILVVVIVIVYINKKSSSLKNMFNTKR